MKLKQTPCSKCGVLLKPYYLKDGVCYGCRHPESIVEAVLPSDKALIQAAINLGKLEIISIGDDES